jgi:PII-like signaling protein
MKTEMFQRRRIEILVDRPLVPHIVKAALAAGITGYSLLPTVGGLGRTGTWSDDDISGAQSKLVFLSIASQEKVDDFVERVKPLLDSHGLILLIGIVDVIRGTRF